MSIVSNLKTPTSLQASLAGAAMVNAFAFLDSYTAISQLAGHYHLQHTWSWPLIVDGLVVVSTVSAASLSTKGHKIYAWALLAVGALLSVGGNGLHAWLSSSDWVAVGMSTVPSFAMLAVTHLTMLLRDQQSATTAAVAAQERVFTHQLPVNGHSPALAFSAG